MPRWGRPPGARLGGQVRRRVTQWEDADGVRFEEIDSGEDDDNQEVRRHAYGDKASARVMRLRSHRYDYDSEISDGEDYDLDDDADSTVAYAIELAMRDDEEWLVERALERIRRAQMLGKKNVRLSRRELDALEKKRMQTGKNSKGSQAKKVGSTRDPVSDKRSDKRRKSDEPVPRGSLSKDDRRRSTREQYAAPYPPASEERMPSVGYGRSSSSSSQRPMQSPRPQHWNAPPDLPQPSPHSKHHSAVREARPRSSSRDLPSPGSFPDDPQWVHRPRPLSNVAPYSVEQSPYLQSYGHPTYRSVLNESHRSSSTSKTQFPHRAPPESSQEESSSEEDEGKEEEDEDDADHGVQVKVIKPSPPRGHRTRDAAAVGVRRRSRRQSGR
ncbi:hypothetical protein VTN77DRAFT_5300 [Rasamsonia byssochlamydoides]|uniref:uncharacterized protein n=1 Tax=Rasamsonia byssochlamydoides TaxID=89139 RepID=UPI0037432F66